MARTQGLLSAARAIHLAYCSLCRVEAERERKIILDQLQNNFALALGFDAAERTVGKVNGPGGRQEALRPRHSPRPLCPPTRRRPSRAQHYPAPGPDTLSTPDR